MIPENKTGTSSLFKKSFLSLKDDIWSPLKTYVLAFAYACSSISREAVKGYLQMWSFSQVLK